MSDLMVSRLPKNEKMVVCAYWLNGDMTVSLSPNSKEEATELLDNIAAIDGLSGLTVMSVKDMMFHGDYVDSSDEPHFKFRELFIGQNYKDLAEKDWGK